MHDSFGRGETADLRAGDTEVDSLDKVALWGPDRQVRAEVITALLLESVAAAPGRARLRVCGIRVIGRLDLSDARIDVPVQFEGCVFDHGVEVLEAKTRTMRFLGCELPYLDADTTELDGHLQVMGSRLEWIGLYGTRVGGHVELSGTRVSKPGGTAVNADYLVVGAAMYCHDITVEGAVRLPGARIAGALELDGAHLLNPGDWALVADLLTVGGDMRCRDGFRAVGEVGLASAQIGGRLHLGGDAPPSHIGPGGSRQARGPGRLSGVVDLRNAKLGGLTDEPSTGPQQLRLNGLCYTDLTPQLPAPGRLEWISRDLSGYQPQPYEQLAACYRRLGHDDDARQVLLAKQRHRRTTLGIAGKIWGLIQDGTVGYGYRPWLAGVWLLALLAVGTAYFFADPPVAASPVQRRFDPFAYSLGVILPIVNQGQSSDWILDGAQKAVFYALTISAWVLVTALVAGVSRQLSRS